MNKSEAYHKKMTEESVSKIIISLGIPTTISMLITNIYNMADTYFVGGLGDSAQAATGILFTLQCIIQAIAFMLGHGSGTFVAKYLAQKNLDRASTYTTTAFVAGGVMGLTLMTLGLTFLEPFLRFLGSTETILPYAKDYGMWILISCPFLICSLVLNNVLRYEGKAFYAMFGLTTGGILNIFGDYLLIEIFDMGVYGAGLSTAISQMISFTILLVLYLKYAQSRLSLKFMAKDGEVYLNIFKMGLPSLIRQGLTSVSNGLLNNLIKPFGDAPIAAMSIVQKYSSFVMCVGLGIGQGYQPFASFNYELKEYDRVKKGSKFLLAFGTIAVGVLATVGFIFAPTIISLFQKDPAVIEVGTPALRYASIGLWFLPISVACNMLYQSIREAAMASFMAIMRSGAVLIPVLLITNALWELDGIIMSQGISDILTGIITLPFFIRFFKKTPSTAEAKENL
ncbi:MAG: MATE family efflux transporter [Clostridia bacterium]|nr:MATE family efflux transporter [Clostridia bacterium]